MIRNNFKDYALDAFLNTHSNFYLSFDEAVNHFNSGEVKISFPDLIKLVEEFENQKSHLPCGHQIGEEVFLALGGPQKAGRVHSVTFFRGNNVKYNLEMLVEGEHQSSYATRIYNIDTEFVTKFKTDE